MKKAKSREKIQRLSENTAKDKSAFCDLIQSIFSLKAPQTRGWRSMSYNFEPNRPKSQEQTEFLDFFSSGKKKKNTEITFETMERDR